LETDRRTPSELLDVVDAKGAEIAEAIRRLRALMDVGAATKEG
jgi:hypothetical protein